MVYENIVLFVYLWCIYVENVEWMLNELGEACLHKQFLLNLVEKLL